MISQIIDFIKNKNFKITPIIISYNPIQTIYEKYISNDNRLFNLNEILNHIRNYRKITPEISALIETINKPDLINIIHISSQCTDSLVETFINNG